MNKKKQAQLTCPHCNAEESVRIPQNGCLAFHECGNCGEMISVPEDSTSTSLPPRRGSQSGSTGDDCCVICAYSNTTCPVDN